MLSDSIFPFKKSLLKRTLHVFYKLYLSSFRLLLMTVVLALWLAIASSTVADSLSDQATADQPSIATAESLFTENCAACHANGGNIIRRGKNLKQRAMRRNGYGEVSAITMIVTQGKGIMPSYADRLSSEEISAIAQYVHEQSEAGW